MAPPIRAPRPTRTPHQGPRAALTETAPRARPQRFTMPLSRTDYDRSPRLSSIERDALRDYVGHLEHRQQHGGSVPELPQALARLVTPLADVTALLPPPTSSERCRHERPTLRLRRLAALVLAEVDRLDRPYWAWSAEEWWALTAHRTRATGYRCCTVGLVATAAYLLCGHILGCGDHPGKRNPIEYRVPAGLIFGPALRDTFARVQDTLRGLGYSLGPQLGRTPQGMFYIALHAQSPYLKDWTPDILRTAYWHAATTRQTRSAITSVARALHALQFVPGPVVLRPTGSGTAERPVGVSESWWRLLAHWYETSTLRERTRRATYHQLCQVARWLAETHPEITSLEEWPQAVAAEFLGAVTQRWTHGQYAGPCGQQRFARSGDRGRPLRAGGMAHILSAVRTLLRDYETWGWGTVPFRPALLSLSRSLRGQLGPKPRVIDAVHFAKLLYAATHVTEADLPAGSIQHYPLAMVQALAVVWTHAGLRSDEIARLPVGCIRWPHADERIPGSTDVVPKEAIAYLTVPDNKTSQTFTKAVHPAVGRAIDTWQAIRPAQPTVIDPTSRHPVDYLFAMRGRRVARAYVNRSLIPMLCTKMGVPDRDHLGRITSHRARTTLASLLLNAPDGMSLTELASWLGHVSLSSTAYYAAITPLRQAHALARASRAVFSVDVLIDLERLGQAVPGVIKYDLGHGYCHYKFFSQCPHRMACARCQHYEPKPASAPQLVELQRSHAVFTHDFTLRPEEAAAMSGDDEAVAALLTRLARVPTPSGETPEALVAARRAAS